MSLAGHFTLFSTHLIDSIKVFKLITLRNRSKVLLRRQMVRNTRCD